MIPSTRTALNKTVLVAGCATLLLFAVPDRVRAEEEKNVEPARSFTNEDLESDRSGAKPRRAAEPSAPVVDPLKPWKDQAERRAWQERQVRDMNAEIASIEDRIEYWEKEKLALRNPLYPHPTPPGQEPGEHNNEGEQDEGLDAVQRVAAADERIAGLRKQLETTRARLVKMEQEFRNPKPVAPAAPQPDRRKRLPVPHPDTPSPS